MKRFYRSALQLCLVGLASLGLGACGSSMYADLSPDEGSVAAKPMNQASVETNGLGEDGEIVSEYSGQNRRLLAGKQTYHFDFNDNRIHKEDIESIHAQAAYLKSHPDAHVRLEGNTDERGSREYNLALGERRAKSVSDYLLAQGVKPAQINSISNGQEKPVDFSHNETAYKLNRRVDLSYDKS